MISEGCIVSESPFLPPDSSRLMRYSQVSIAAVTHQLPPQIVTSEEIERELSPLYQRLKLPAGRLEMMSGISQRRFWDRGTLPGDVSASTARLAIEASGLSPDRIGCLIHGSVCRDQLEPATASKVHHACGLSPAALAMDLSNACLGLLNGMLVIANMIELGEIDAGIVVGTEDARSLVEGTIHTLLNTEDLKRHDVKSAFASLTIGSGSAAVALARRELVPAAPRLVGAAVQADSSGYKLCEGGSNASGYGDDRPRMQTDSEALLHAGINLARKTWENFLRERFFGDESVNKTFSHQVGKVHRKLLYQRLDLDPAFDFPTVEFLGNTGAVALPTAWSLGMEAGHVSAGDRIGLLGIGSGLNSIMLAVDWR